VRTPELSVVIPTHNNLPALRKCVDSWRTHAGGQPLELIIVEDGCRDETPAYLADLIRTPWGERHVRVLHEDDVHEQRCTNRGLTDSRAPLVLVWQDDMFVAASWLVGELRASFAAHHDLALLGLTRGLNCQPHPEPIRRWEDLTDWNRLPSTIGPPMFNWLRIQEVDFVIRPWIVRRAAIEGVGPLDPAFALSEWDEADLAFRIRRAGWRVGTHGYERLGAYTHLGSATLDRTFSDRYKAQVLENGLLFHRRWDETIAREHPRPRRTWWRRSSVGGWAATAAGLARRLFVRARPDTVARGIA
jgi:glycosyltransferase involved in cell wall biosynthesis